MEFILDTANIEDIKKYKDMINLAGVTTNPSICKKENIKDFWKHMNEICSLIGKNRSFHVQVVGRDYESMIKDAEAILEKIDENVFIKVPVTEVGLKVMKQLKEDNISVTATGIYTKMQAYLAVNIGVDYIAPYYNRMENHNINAQAAIADVATLIKENNLETKILAASFKNINQVTTAFEKGSHSVTISSEILEDALNLSMIKQAVTDFSNDWESLYGERATVSTLKED